VAPVLAQTADDARSIRRRRLAFNDGHGALIGMRLILQ
jgi:hypothetical protein